MKIIQSILPFLAICSLVFVQSCTKDKYMETQVYKINKPIYLSFDDLRKSAGPESPRMLKNPGKIYSYHNYLLINERGEGVHVFDNSNPASPVNLAFINVPGNVDLAVNNGVLYVDSYTDLVAYDLTNVNQISEVHRVEDAFPYTYNYEGYDQRYHTAAIDQQRGVVVDWKVEEVRESCEDDDCNRVFIQEYGYVDVLVNVDAAGGVPLNSNPAAIPGSGGGDGGAGTGGSMARFIFFANNLYTISGDFELKLFDVSDATQPVYQSTVSINETIETLFTYHDKLFIGAPNGMSIYDLSSPDNPTYIGEFRHARACDPVVVYGQYAYVTLRGGTECRGFENQLDVIDISSLTNPTLVKSYDMVGPYGLGVDGIREMLFVCDGDAGLKVYKSTDPEAISDNQLAHYDNINAFDVIPLAGTLLMIGSDGFYQYDYTDPNNITLLSTIPVMP